MRSVLVAAVLVAAGCSVLVAAPAQAHATAGYGVDASQLARDAPDPGCGFR